MGLAISHEYTLLSRGNSFQFPFHRDGPCDSNRLSSVGASLISFSSLFIGMGLAILDRLHVEDFLEMFFQFPFHRDGPCDFHMPLSLSMTSSTFSSLFIGMGLAILNEK